MELYGRRHGRRQSLVGYGGRRRRNGEHVRLAKGGKEVLTDAKRQSGS
jgi:hypothetical protein